MDSFTTECGHWRTAAKYSRSVSLRYCLHAMEILALPIFSDIDYDHGNSTLIRSKLSVSITSQRRTDPINVRYPKTARMITNDFGVFYKIRGGKLSAAFKTEADAKKDLRVFLEILKIEQELNTDDLKLIV